MATVVKFDVPALAFREPGQADRPSRVPRELLAKDWVRAVREALGFTQEKLIELIDAPGNRSVAKWEGGVVQPNFQYTRRIATLAPWPLQAAFLGRSTDSVPMSDPDRKVAPSKTEERVVVTPEGIMVGRELDEIENIELRKRARTAALAAIDAERSKSHPSEASAGEKASRARSTK